MNANDRCKCSDTGYKCIRVLVILCMCVNAEFHHAKRNTWKTTLRPLKQMHEKLIISAFRSTTVIQRHWCRDTVKMTAK